MASPGPAGNFFFNFAFCKHNHCLWFTARRPPRPWRSTSCRGLCSPSLLCETHARVRGLRWVSRLVGWLRRWPRVQTCAQNTQTHSHKTHTHTHVSLTNTRAHARRALSGIVIASLCMVVDVKSLFVPLPSMTPECQVGQACTCTQAGTRRIEQARSSVLTLCSGRERRALPHACVRAPSCVRVCQPFWCTA